MSAFRTDQLPPWSDPERNSLQQLSLRACRAIGRFWQLVAGKTGDLRVWRYTFWSKSLPYSHAGRSPEPVFFGKQWFLHRVFTAACFLLAAKFVSEYGPDVTQKRAEVTLFLTETATSYGVGLPTPGVRRCASGVFSVEIAWIVRGSRGS